MKILGIVLIVAGALALVYQGITYTTRRDSVRVGPIGVTAEQRETIPLPPIIGVVAIVAGVGLLVASRRRV